MDNLYDSVGHIEDAIDFDFFSILNISYIGYRAYFSLKLEANMCVNLVCFENVINGAYVTTPFYINDTISFSCDVDNIYCMDKVIPVNSLNKIFYVDR